MHEYTGLPVAYLLKANLRVNGGEYKNHRDYRHRKRVFLYPLRPAKSATKAA